MTPAREPTAAPLIDFAGLYAAYARDVRRFALFLAGDAALAGVLWTAYVILSRGLRVPGL
jgi:hypothetical protein